MRTTPDVHRIQGARLRVLAVMFASALSAATILGAGAAAASSPIPTGVHVFGWAFTNPSAIVSDGAHVWVANAGGNSVLEFSASTGSLVRVIVGQGYAFAGPDAITVNGGRIWVANAADSSVTELDAATGDPVRGDFRRELPVQVPRVNRQLRR